MKRRLQVHSQKQVQENIKSENERLLQRLMQVKPSMNIEEPKRFHHITANPKKKQLMEGNYHYQP